jgi:hypothetical protein
VPNTDKPLATIYTNKASHPVSGWLYRYFASHCISLLKFGVQVKKQPEYFFSSASALAFVALPAIA